jgi:hypothetical protein
MGQLVPLQRDVTIHCKRCKSLHAEKQCILKAK